MRTKLCLLLLLHLVVALPLRAQVWAPATKVDPAPKPPGFSGMARLDASSFLVVHDVKSPSTEPRLSVLSVGFGRAPYVTPVVFDWGPIDPPNDLESICPIPG